MDRHVPPRVTYWTGIWSPAREAISAEVELLRRHQRRRSIVVSISAGQRTTWWPADGVFRLAGSRQSLVRALGIALEPLGDVSHVLGSPNSWHLLRAVGRRPTILTVVLPGPVNPADYEKVAVIAVESELLQNQLLAAGVPARKVRLIYPGVDLHHFRSGPAPDHRFTVLFASTPASPSEFDDRGISLMVETARRYPDVCFLVPWRRWGNATNTQEALSRLKPPSNFQVEHGDLADMAQAYGRVHAVICLFAPDFGKSCPNSVIEGLACGRPAILSRSCGIAGAVARHAAGIAVDRHAEAVGEGIERVRSDYERFSVNARALAEQHFDVKRFLGAYRDLYTEVSCGVALTPRNGVHVGDSQLHTEP